MIDYWFFILCMLEEVCDRIWFAKPILNHRISLIWSCFICWRWLWCLIFLFWRSRRCLFGWWRWRVGRRVTSSSTIIRYLRLFRLNRRWIRWGRRLCRRCRRRWIRWGGRLCRRCRRRWIRRLCRRCRRRWCWWSCCINILLHLSLVVLNWRRGRRCRFRFWGWRRGYWGWSRRRRWSFEVQILWINFFGVIS